MNHAFEHSRKIKEEAEQLLTQTKLENLLAKFGQVNLDGSYAYNLMVDRDLDFGVAVRSVTPEIRAEIARTFASQSWAYSVNITDRVNFEPLSNLGAPRGLYLGLTIPFPIERWNIDVWFVVSEDLPQDNIANLVQNATSEQRSAILQIKYDLMQSGQKQKGQTSSEIYKAVLQKNIKTTAEFLELQTLT
ncbi:hypothetical protein H0V99_00105 [Candidatus Saccharibacteria bacterium]|nr:hypothetical protein [Candidatus Saccharibacteria bacterium]